MAFEGAGHPHLSRLRLYCALKVQDILIYQGSGFIVPVSGKIMLMPGTSANPAYRRVEVDVETGKVKGLF